MKRLRKFTENDYVAHCIKFRYFINPHQKQKFYQSEEWKTLKEFTKDIFINECFKCGSTENIQVDHIKPISISPWLALNPKNIQILCKKCNDEKSNMNSNRYEFRFKVGEYVTPTKEILDNVEKYLIYFPKLEPRKRKTGKRYDLNKIFPSTL